VVTDVGSKKDAMRLTCGAATFPRTNGRTDAQRERHRRDHNL